MLTTLAIGNYRSINHLVLPLGQLNLVTGANGSGKSNLYKALRLLAETAQGGLIEALAREGGLDSTWWAGPANSARMKRGEVPIQGQHPSEARRLRLALPPRTSVLPSPSACRFPCRIRPRSCSTLR